MRKLHVERETGNQGAKQGKQRKGWGVLGTDGVERTGEERGKASKEKEKRSRQKVVALLSPWQGGLIALAAWRFGWG